MTDSTQEREARNYIKEVVADLETELEMYEQALTRANAVIERVVADLGVVVGHRRKLSGTSADSLRLDAIMDDVARIRRTILEGADNE